MSDWQDIDTAPRDGTWIELWRGPVTGPGAWSPLIVARWWEFDGVYATWAWPDESAVDPWHDPDGAIEYLERGDCYDSTEHFTHWRPLSTPPVSP